MPDLSGITGPLEKHKNIFIAGGVAIVGVIGYNLYKSKSSSAATTTATPTTLLNTGTSGETLTISGTGNNGTPGPTPTPTTVGAITASPVGAFAGSGFLPQNVGLGDIPNNAGIYTASDSAGNLFDWLNPAQWAGIGANIPIYDEVAPDVFDLVGTGQTLTAPLAPDTPLYIALPTGASANTAPSTGVPALSPNAKAAANAIGPSLVGKPPG